MPCSSAQLASVTEMKRHLAAHLHFYNHRRTHHSLGGLLVPADRYYGRVEEVLERLEAGGGDIHTEFIGIRDRTLDVLRIVNRDGQLEFWLLGQRLYTAPSSHE